MRLGNDRVELNLIDPHIALIADDRLGDALQRCFALIQEEAQIVR